MMTSCDTTTVDINKACVDTLQQALHHAPGFFIKVHAGEALIANGDTTGIESTFLSLRRSNPDYATGATRVLAKLYAAHSPEKHTACLKLVEDQYLHGDSTHARLVALESLGKMGYSTPLPEIVRDAQTGESGFRAMARWVLANGGTQAGEDSLAALLTYLDVADYRSAAYALRFKASASTGTYQLLEKCVNRLSPADPARVYVLSALFVHTPVEKKDAVKTSLLQYLNGLPAARYETAEALSLKGTRKELPILEKLLKDADPDVRVAAANAILKINKRN